MSLLIRVSTACRKHGIADSSFGRDAVGDPCFVTDLRRGREPRAKTVEKVEAYLAKLDSRS